MANLPMFSDLLLDMVYWSIIFKYMSKVIKSREYQSVFQEETEGGFSVWVPDLPGCASQGETLEEALENIKEAIELYLLDSAISVDAADYEYKRQFVIPVKLAHA
jgi:predicted RNase H-like HicB family nuclease